MKLITSLFLLLCVSISFTNAQKVQRFKQQALAEAIKLESEVDRMADYLWHLSETALLEHKSVYMLTQTLEQEGFTIERGVAGMPTAFIATYGSGQPIIGVLAEYDALPGVGNEALPEKTERKDKVTNGHGCGHNLFGAASVTSAIAIKRTMEKNNIPGTIRLYGCPAEETVIGKVYMAKAGLFDDLDGALHWHPGTETKVWNNTGLALNNFEVEFYGKSAHGAFDPWNGRSALDAVEMMNYGVNLMREHIPPSARIHYVIVDGGGAPNVVPAKAKVWYFVRDVNRDLVINHYERIKKIVEGAALATETEYKINLLTGVHEVIVNEPLFREIQANMESIGPIQYSEKEDTFAKEMQKNSGREELGMKKIIEAIEDKFPASTDGGSTDVAEVSYITPTGGFSAITAPEGIPWHSWQASSSHGTSLGKKGANFAAKVLAMTGIEMLTNPKLMDSAKKDFLGRTGGKPYVCPIPIDQKPPLPEGSGTN